MPGSYSTIVAQSRILATTFAQTIAGGSSLTVQLSSLEWFAATRVIAASSGSTTNPHSFLIELYQGHQQGTWLSRQFTRCSTSGAIQFDNIGRFGALVITMGSSAGYVTGAAYMIPVS